MTIYNRPDDLPAFAESGDKVQPSNAEIQTGWPLSTVPPSRQRFNWILNFVSNAVRYFMQRGIAEWSIDEDYPLAGRVQHAGVTWVAILANTGIEPGTDPLSWERWGYAESELATFIDPITPDATNNRVGVNNAAPEVTLDIIGTDAVRLPVGTTAQRPAGEDGFIRKNSTLDVIEAWIGGAWAVIGGAIADASTTVKGIIKTSTDAITQTGTATDVAVTPASARSNTATAASDPTRADNSTKWATTNWIYGAMGAIATAAGFAYSFGVSGYFKFPNWFAGFIFQWGKSSVAADGSAVVSLPITFPNAPFIAVVSLESSTVAGAEGTESYNNLTTTQITLRNGTNIARDVTFLTWGN